MTEYINVEVSGGRGPKGMDGIGTRYLYVVKLRRTVSDVDVVETILNTTGKTFTWSRSNGILRVTCSDELYLEKILSITYFRNSAITYPYIIGKSVSRDVPYISISIQDLQFSTDESNEYTACLEFYNY